MFRSCPVLSVSVSINFADPFTGNVQNGLSYLLDSPSNREPLARDCASVPTVVRPRENVVPDSSVPRQPPRPGSTPLCNPGNTRIPPQVRPATPPGQIKLSAIVTSNQTYHSGLFNEPVNSMDAEDPELVALLSAPPRDPVPCFL